MIFMNFMTIEEKNDKCKIFFDELCNMLGEGYELLGSCNKDISAYLCPVGTTEKVTYKSKPELSFRISDHWNWYSNTKKCSDPKYIQCFSKDLPWVRKRLAEGKASKPIMASCVCLFRDGIYHVVYGECFNRKTKTWSWIENSPEKVIFELLNKGQVA